MAETDSPLVKAEPIAPLLYQPYPYPPTYPAITIDGLPPANMKPQRRTDTPDGLGEVDSASLQRSKKQKISGGKAGSGRGTMAGSGHSLSADEITYTPITHRISKAKKGKKVHGCTFPGCPKIFTRAEHRRRHEANHNAHPAFQCQMEGCKKPFQRADLLTRHMERQHNIPMDAASNRSGRSLSGTSSPVGMISHTPRPTHSTSSSAIMQSAGSKGLGSYVERHVRDSSYRAQSVPPSLHDHLSAQHPGTVHHGLPNGVVYGVSPSGDSLCSSSDSCYSPPSDYYPNPRGLQPNYSYAPEVVQRPHSALESNYQSLETSPLSVGPPTPVSTTNWNPAFDPNSMAFIPESHCLPPRQYPHTPPWPHTNGMGFHDMQIAAKAGWN